jgi:hypothetical protein
MTTLDSTPRPLWLTFRGASGDLVAAWIVWTAAAVVAGLALVGVAGPGGAAVGILTAGWLVARRARAPIEWLRRYHLDDLEVMALGPWRRIQRLTWAQVEHVTQERHALVLSASSGSVALPLKPLLATSAWAPVLAQVVPSLAGEMWERLDDGAVRLVPHADPPTSGLIWWAYVPAALACAAGLGTAGLAVAATLAAAERALAWLVGRARQCVLHPAGIDVRGRRGRIFVPWAQALVTPEEGGLGVGVPGRDPGFVSTAAPSFWAAAAVIELRAQLGPYYAADVHFRVRYENGGVSVVGEIESLH